MGILKTAMYSGAAMYGVKQLAKAAESHGSHASRSSNGQDGAAMDPEYLKYLEWKSRTAQPKGVEGSALERVQVCGYQTAQAPPEDYSADQKLYLVDNKPPEYDYSFPDYRSTAARYQPMAFRSPRPGFVDEPLEGNSRENRRGLDIDALIGQGLGMLQSQGTNSGSGKGRGDFVSKFLNK